MTISMFLTVIIAVAALAAKSSANPVTLNGALPSAVLGVMPTGITSSLLSILSSASNAGLVPSSLAVTPTALGVPTPSLTTDALGNIITLPTLTSLPTSSPSASIPSVTLPSVPGLTSPGVSLPTSGLSVSVPSVTLLTNGLSSISVPVASLTSLIPTTSGTPNIATLVANINSAIEILQVIQAIVNGLGTGNGGIAIPGIPVPGIGLGVSSNVLQILQGILMTLVSAIQL